MKIIGSQFKRIWGSGSILVPKDMFVSMSIDAHARDIQLVYGSNSSIIYNSHMNSQPLSISDCFTSEYNVETISCPSMIKSIIIFK